MYFFLLDHPAKGRTDRAPGGLLEDPGPPFPLGQQGQAGPGVLRREWFRVSEAEAAWLGFFRVNGLGAGLAVVVTPLARPSWQCAEDPDAVCTRSVTVRLPGPHHGLLKLKHGGGVALDGQDVQIPLLQGGRSPSLEPPTRLALGAPTLTAASSVRM